MLDALRTEVLEANLSFKGVDWFSLHSGTRAGSIENVGSWSSNLAAYLTRSSRQKTWSSSAWTEPELKVT